MNLRASLSRVNAFNDWLATKLTALVFTMWTFYAFNILAFSSLPSVLATANMALLVQWTSSNWIQLVLLPAIGVGQVLMAKQQEKHTERLDKLQESHDTIHEKLDSLHAKLGDQS